MNIKITILITPYLQLSYDITLHPTIPTTPQKHENDILVFICFRPQLFHYSTGQLLCFFSKVKMRLDENEQDEREVKSGNDK